jgi:hypothetical protein
LYLFLFFFFWLLYCLSFGYCIAFLLAIVLPFFPRFTASSYPFIVIIHHLCGSYLV